MVPRMSFVIAAMTVLELTPSTELGTQPQRVGAQPPLVARVLENTLEIVDDLR